MSPEFCHVSYPAVSPSLLAADASNLNGEIDKAISCGCRFIHIDVMDGIFVPAHSFGLPFVKGLAKRHDFIKDVHLMIADPSSYAKGYAISGADIITFHYEACVDDRTRRRTISLICENGSRAGISLKPQTPVSAIFPYLSDVSLVLVMSVEPGKGGQSFLPKSLTRIKEIKKAINLLSPEKRPLLEVDGGINGETGPAAIRAGADILVAGSYLYGHLDFASRVKRLLS